MMLQQNTVVLLSEYFFHQGLKAIKTKHVNHFKLMSSIWSHVAWAVVEKYSGNCS